VKNTVFEVPMLPAKSQAYAVMLCFPSAKPARVVFPPIETFSFPSKLYAILEVGSSTAKFNGISRLSNIMFSNNRTETIGEVRSIVKKTKE
jgi:hypothetical protein